MDRVPTATIVKHRCSGVVPNLEQYAAVDPDAFWAAARAELQGLPGGRGLNIAHEAVDRHLAGPVRDRIALRFIARDGIRHDSTYADLARETNRFANVLRGLGVAPGDLVCSLAGRIPQLYIAALGTLKARSVFSPLFSAFGPEPIRTRLRARPGAGAGHDRGAVPAQGRGAAALAARRSSTCCSSARVARRPRSRERTTSHACCARRVASSRSSRPTPRTRRSSTSRAARPAGPRRRCTCTARWSRIASRRSSRSTSIPTTSSGARPTRAG